MKSVKMFGRSIPILAIIAVVMTAGIGGAYLVDYLSNTVTATITVQSPMLVGVSLGRDSWATTQCWRPAYDGNPGAMVDSFPESDISNIHDWAWSDWEMTEASLSIPVTRGGETVTLYIMSRNLADAEITGLEEAIVYNSEKVTSDDFKSVTVRTDSIYGDLGYGTEHELIPGGIIQLTPCKVQFGTDGSSTWGAGEMDVTKIVVTFKPEAFGTYTFTYRVVPVEA